MAFKKNIKGGGKMKTTQKNKKPAKKSPFAMKDMLVSLNDTVKEQTRNFKKTISKYAIR